MLPDTPAADAPIGVFDSGIGGLSVLQALRDELPSERYVYLADSANAPYGERGDAFVEARTHAVVRQLRERHGIKALVVACNTATMAAIRQVRAEHPDLPLVGVEPAVKPAVAATRTGRIGVIGTRGAMASARLAELLASLHGQAEFVVQPCDGLAAAIEQDRSPDLHGRPQNAPEVMALCLRHTSAMGRFGSEDGDIDTLVLGCTHYRFAEPALRAILGPEVRLIDAGVPVARQTARLLAAQGRLCGTAPRPGDAPGVTLLSTGDPAPLQAAAGRWLGLHLHARSACEAATASAA